MRSSYSLLFLWAEQPHLSQSFILGEVFHPSDYFCGPPLDLLQQVHVFLVLRAPELDARLQVGSHQNGAEGQNPLLRPAGHASFDAAQDTIGFLGCERTLLGHVELLINQHPQVRVLRAALNPFSAQPVFVLGIVPIHVQDVAFGLVEPHEFRTGPLSSLSRSLWMASHPASVLTGPHSLVSSANLVRVHSILLSISLTKMLNSAGPNTDT